MADLLFVTWDGGGNLPPALGIAHELQRRGHAVRFLGNPSQAVALATAGVEVVPTRHTRRFASQEPKSAVAFVAAVGDRRPGADLVEAVTARPADLVVVDCMSFGALDAAWRHGLRFAVLEHLYDGYYQRGCLRGPLGLSLILRRQRPRRALAEAVGRVAAVAPELDPGSAVATSLTYTGPVVDSSPVLADRTGDPMVLVSLSTCSFPGMRESLQRILDAVSLLDARVVVTTGPAIDPADLSVPARFEVHRFAPHAEVMPGASLLIGHGGHGTTMQALAHDLPVVVMPMEAHTDQPMVGRSLEEAGAGRLLSKKASTEQIALVVSAMLADGPHRAAAARLGAVVRARSGAARGADALEALLSSDDAAREPGPRAARP